MADSAGAVPRSECGADVAVVWHDDFLHYRLSDEHPLHPVRLALTMDLASRLGVLDRPGVRLVRPEPAGDELLTRVHDRDYLDAVRRAPEEPFWPSHGLGTSDNPVFPRMHEASALISGGSVLAAQSVWTGQPGGAGGAGGAGEAGRPVHAVNIAGGLHHAMRSAASGFCVYNDPAIAIGWLLDHGAERVGYVDVDVHHGDGVQAAFYDDPRVLTISLHQSPMSLFPGTGFAEELGTGDAVGTSVNVALPPGTDDAGWLRAFHAVVPGLLRAFGPQVLVSQCGCDTHRDDPLAELALSVDGQRASYLAMHRLAHELCDGRWLALGGGGYGLVRCVPRAWTHLLAVATGDPLDPDTPVPPGWIAEVRRRGFAGPTPDSMTDGGDADWTRWQPSSPADASRLDRAILAARRAAYPLHGLDPDDPRD